MPVISVIIPVFNAEKYLARCVRSVLNQSFTDIQVILVNDGSTDKSRVICEELAKSDIRVNVYNQSNQGVSATRNFGISKAISKYICFVDADDEIDPSLLKHLYYEIEQSNVKVDLVICGHNSIYHNSNEIKAHAPPYFKGDIKKFLNNLGKYFRSETIQGPCGKLFKTNLIQENNIHFPNDISYGEDTVFVVNYLKSCRYIVSIEKCLYYYMIRGNNSLSSSYRVDKMEIFLRINNEVEELMKLNNIVDYKNIISQNICIAVIACFGELYSQKKNSLHRKNVLDFVLGNKEIYNSFYYQKHHNLQYNLLFYLIKRKMRVTISVYFQIKKILKNISL